MFGWSAGKNAAKYTSSECHGDIESARDEIEEKKSFFDEIMAREEGAKWQESLSALQQVMMDYCGNVRSEILLESGLDIIKRLKKKT